MPRQCTTDLSPQYNSSSSKQSIIVPDHRKHLEITITLTSTVSFTNVSTKLSRYSQALYLPPSRLHSKTRQWYSEITINMSPFLNRVTGRSARARKNVTKQINADNIKAEIEDHHDRLRYADEQLDLIACLSNEKRRSPEPRHRVFDIDFVQAWTTLRDRILEVQEGFEAICKIWDGRNMDEWNQQRQSLQKKMEALEDESRRLFLKESGNIEDENRRMRVKSTLEDVLEASATKRHKEERRARNPRRK